MCEEGLWVQGYGVGCTCALHTHMIQPPDLNAALESPGGQGSTRLNPDPFLECPPPGGGRVCSALLKLLIQIWESKNQAL